MGQRFASREAMRTSQADSYRRQILSAQDAVRREAAARRLEVAGSVDTLLNAVFIIATPDQLNDARSIAGVMAVIPMRMGKPDMNRANQLIGSPAAWTALGGQANAGQGIKIGIIDSGIDNTHPAFSDAGYAAPSGFPKCSGFTEPCANFTNNKVIVARSYVRQSSGTNPATSRPDDFSPRDHDGHGSAVASVAAGGTASGTVSFTGVAPRAYLGSYKVYGSPFVNDYFTEDSLIKAVEDAVNDGMDVINFSSHIVPISGPLDTGAKCGQPAGTPCDALATAFENAAQKTVITVSAGNNGEDGFNYPTFNSIGSPANAPSVIAVGASTNSHFFTQSVTVNDSGAPSGLKNMVALPGDDQFAPLGALSAPVVDITAVGGDTYGCDPAPPAGSLTGAFALIQRGPQTGTPCFFSDKVSNALDAGAVGVILYNYDASTPPFPGNLNGFGVPVGMLTNANGLALKDYLGSHPGAVVTIDPAGLEVDDPADANIFLGFSSMGPNLGDAAMKPEVVAVGFDMYMAAENVDPLGGQFSVTRYAVAGGTSFSAPLVAGAAALVKQKHPTWTPAQIKSALVNTATQDATQDDGGDTISIQYQGGGKINAGSAVNATVLANPPTVSFGVLTADPSNLGKQVTITNTGT
ncbi:MAG TPA: S8 family serine peptidase, partial [Bryobacteraceae bacterium]